MPFAWKLVIDETHAADVPDREGSLGAICVVVHSLQSVDVLLRVRKLVPVDDCLVLVAVTQKCVTEHHLSHSDCAAPPAVSGLANLELATDVSRQGFEPLYKLFFLPDKQWLEVATVTQPDQRVKVHLELCVHVFNLLVEVFVLRVDCLLWVPFV
jgi:hypothetical protein